ncbi:MAG TPA: response regulator [Deltaproteobacteria bacterium]|nr:response regulator [Deltaproteobacteria bacterium]
MQTAEIRILLVEANPRDRLAFRSAVERGGMDCILVESDCAASAVSLLKDRGDAFDLVAADVKLPDASGLDFFREVKALVDLPAFVIISGPESIDAVAEALKEGACGYIIKDPQDSWTALLPMVIRGAVERRTDRRFRHEAEETLRDAHRTMEKEVRKRTAQLMRANRRLKQEIEERKRLEEDLKQNEEQFMLFMEHFPGMVYLKDGQGRYLYLSRYLEDAYGIRVDTCIGKTDRDLWPEEISGAIMEDDRKVLASGKELQKVEDIAFGDIRVSFFTQKFPILQDTSLTMLGGVSIDITDYRRTEQENRLLVSAVENTAESVFILDSKGRILYLNQAGEHSLETPRSDLTGKPYEMFLTPDTGSCPPLSLKDIHSKPWRGTIQRVRSDGAIRELDIVVSPLQDEAGTVTNYAVIELDVTEERAMQKALERKRRMEALGLLAGGIAHDFINILQPILINAELVSDMLPPDAPEREFIDQIIEASRIGREVTNQIKMFGSRKKTAFKPVPLDDVVRDALHIIRRSLPPAVTFHQRISCRGRLVRTDAAQIYQLLTNLCTNAVQAMEDGQGTLSVSLTPVVIRTAVPAVISDLVPGQYLKLTVKDTGCGMAPEVVDQIFDPLFTTRKSRSGTGLGLGVAHSVVKNAGGSIIVRSTPGQGSAFEVYFPEHREGGVQPVRDASPPAGRRKPRILLVDDNTMELRSVHQMLVRMGFRVSSTNDSIKALDIFMQSPDAFDLVVSDQLMPVMKGSDLVLELRKTRKTLPVIICSGSDDALKELRGMADPFLSLLAKPFSTQALRDAIDLILGRGGFTFS